MKQLTPVQAAAVSGGMNCHHSLDDDMLPPPQPTPDTLFEPPVPKWAKVGGLQTRCPLAPAALM